MSDIMIYNKKCKGKACKGGTDRIINRIQYDSNSWETLY